MNMESFNIYSYLLATISYGFLLALSLWGIKKYSSGLTFFIATLFSFIWAGYTSYNLYNDELYSSSILPFETLRNLAWYVFLLTMLACLEPQNDCSKKISRSFAFEKFTTFFKSNYTLSLIAITLFVFVAELIPELMFELNYLLGMDFRLFSHVGFAIIGLILVEQLYRNVLSEQRWAIKFICLGLGGLFTFDFIIYSKSLLFSDIDVVLWNVRGMINALIVPLLAISVIRLQENSISYTISRQVIFHTSALVGTGLYLIFMSIAGFYIKEYGGNWGEVAQILFIFLAVLMLMVLLFSGTIRAKLKVYFNKHFFHYRYDYREEWINLSKTLAELNSINELSHVMIKTLANLVDSSCGGLWVQNEQGDYYLAEDYKLRFVDSTLDLIKQSDDAVQFLTTKQWVIDLFEYENNPEIYEQENFSPWLNKQNNIWLLIPILQQNQLKAFVVLTKPRATRRLNWEDHDLLRTVGMQLANAFVLSQASDELSTARQFEAYSRLSAFIIHDLKNLVAQVSLIVKNAEKHKNNPEFIDDAIDTLENVVVKMQKLVNQLRQRNTEDSQSTLDLVVLINDIVKQQSAQTPMPQFHTELVECLITGEQEKISAILGHLVQNAQDATADDGSVTLELDIAESPVENHAIIKIIDTGSGMDKKFIAERLFKPFDTTKGNAGMGIGVYEAKSYILRHSGTISVESEINNGTTFTLHLPLSFESQKQAQTTVIQGEINE
ncbi:MAG: PEP-CTERM system histidine kinase PrsK [Gammaproteobacteria bacterium]|nr:PEP-CTERM system histidine kinase PrsK [Gammaproteobacteria bacterium]